MVEHAVIGGIDGPDGTHQRIITAIDVSLVRFHSLNLVITAQRHDLDAVGKVDDAHLVLGLQFLILLCYGDLGRGIETVVY